MYPAGGTQIMGTVIAIFGDRGDREHAAPAHVPNR